MNKFCGFLIVLGVWQLAGCAPMTRENVQPNDPLYAPVNPRDYERPVMVNGSIHSAAPRFNLFGDRKAHDVGDVLTVVLEERTQSSKSTDSSLTKDSDVTFNDATILGTNITPKNLSLETNISQEREFEGEADANQSNSLTGNISVTVADVLPNGLLRIRGEKWLTIAEGDEYIRLSGLVRPEDISIDNTVLSTKIADARIAYSATGAFADVNRVGWFGRFLNSEWWPL